MSKSEIKQAQPALAEASLFTEAGVQFLATYRGWLMAAVWLAARAYVLWGLTPDDVVESYLQIGGDWLGGFTPYSDFCWRLP